MTELKICVGSCCFSQGAGQMIEYFKTQKNCTTAEIELCGSFCLNKCDQGVTIVINDEIYKVKSIDEILMLVEKLRGSE